MVSRDNSWGFYGRQMELARIERWMTADSFGVHGVVGGRGVGKTTLIKHAGEQFCGNRPFVYLELPVIAAGESEYSANLSAFDLYKSLLVQLDDLGLKEEITQLLDSRGTFVVPGLTANDLHRTIGFSDMGGLPPALAITDAFWALLKIGAVVVLDEFQNAANMGIVSIVKRIVDEFKTHPVFRCKGTAILAGSHQQKMLTMMYDSASPMYQRVSSDLRIYPLPAPALFEMAVERSWIDYPARFLTAYTAFGGIPRLWEDLARAQNEGRLQEPNDGIDDKWRERFIKWRVETLVKDPAESYFHKAYMSLSNDPAELFAYLVKFPYGVRWSDVVDFFNSGGELTDTDRRRSDAAYWVLRHHLDIVEPVKLPRGKVIQPIRKVRIKENAAAFEAAIMPLFLDDDKEWADPIPEAAVMELTRREGFALERLAKEYFEYAAGMGKAYSSVEYVLPDRDNLEIDVVAEPEFEDTASEHRIVLCSCKRNCRRHLLRKTMADFDLYLKLRRDDGASWEDHNVFRYLVSPDWGENKIQSSLFKCLDFADMAASEEHKWT